MSQAKQHGEVLSVNDFRDYFKLGKKPEVAPKKSKYGNVKAEANGKKFDSTKEKNRYLELNQMMEKGQISELHEQVKFTFVHNDIKIGSYVADFTYNKDGKEIVEDVKSEVTKKIPLYRWKKKMMLAFFNIEVQEI